MLANSNITHDVHSPVAIFDKELLRATTFTVKTFELCTMCGARFGIGYQGTCEAGSQPTDETEELPRKLTEILAKDHLQNRAHKPFIELDF
jgi:hypothetical protein